MVSSNPLSVSVFLWCLTPTGDTTGRLIRPRAKGSAKLHTARASMRAAVALLLVAATHAHNVGFTIEEPTGFKVVSSGAHGGSLSVVELATSAYAAEAPPYLLRLEGSRYEMGYDLGLLFGEQSVANYESLLKAILGSSTLEPLEEDALAAFLDWQWDDFMASHVPAEYHDELRGTTDGGAAAGVESVELGTVLSRGIVLANLPGSLQDLVYVLEDELEHPNTTTATGAYKRAQSAALKAGFPSVAAFAGRLQTTFKPLGCSMIGMWGNRTEQGRLLSGRNLDWESDTGINSFKVVTVFRPTNATPHATMGFGGLLGALTGMSGRGLTVYEANLEESPESFRGFAWMLRLRYLMERAGTIQEALELWNATQNTVGFNHGIGSAAEDRLVVLETNANRTAVFSDMDPREASATWTPNSSAPPQQIGFPLPDAVWRTNNPFDPEMRRNFLWSQAPSSNTQTRYRIIHDAIMDLEGTRGTPVDIVNITAVVGQKGPDYYNCKDFKGGSNVLSVAYDSQNLMAYVAWEAGSHDTWVPAACSTYVQLNMSALLAP